MVKAIQNLGMGTEKAGVCGVLRVLISHPASPNVGAPEEAVEDEHGHPLATVHIPSLKPEKSDMGESILSLAKRKLTAPDRKRKSIDEPTGSETGSLKRRKK